MKQRAKAGRKRTPDEHALPDSERAELHRQGAKAAARGERIEANPMDEPVNRPEATGECSTTWQLRRDAWASGHHAQSRYRVRGSAPVNSAPMSPGEGPEELSTSAVPNGKQQLLSLRRQIRDAQETLDSLHESIARAHSDQGLRAMLAVASENDRLHIALQEQGARAAEEADSAHAALEDAVRASETDPLTRLPNRTVMWDRLLHDLALARRRDMPLAVLFIDLDEFKAINDRYGHAVGDELLRHVARVLTQSVRASDTVCRIGGDEFVIVANEIANADLPGFVQKLAEAVSFPCVLVGLPLVPSLSIGSSSFPDDATEPDALLRLADAAMYRVKRERRATRRVAAGAGAGAGAAGAAGAGSPEAYDEKPKRGSLGERT